MSTMTTTPSRTVNGIAVDDVQALIGAVAADPAAGLTRWRVANTWLGRLRSRGQVDGFEIGGRAVARTFALDVDEPLEIGGTNLDANPQEYLLTAFNACITAGFAAYCALHGVKIEKMEIVTEGEIDLRGFLGLDPSVSPGFDRLQSVMTVKGSASPEEFQRIFDLALAASPNLHNIRRPIEVAPKLVVA